MNEHNAVKPLLEAFVAGTLQAADSERVQRHLDFCADCLRDATILQRLIRAVQRLPEDRPSPECLDRIAALATSRRMEVLENRRQAGLTAAVTLLGWTMVITTLPLWQRLAEAARTWSGWQISSGPLTAFALGSLLSYLFLPGLWALLERHRITDYREGRR